MVYRITDSSAQQTIKTWPVQGGHVKLIHDGKSFQVSVIRNGQIFDNIPKENIHGIPQTFEKNITLLRSFLDDTYVQVRESERSYSVSIKGRLRGGGEPNQTNNDQDTKTNSQQSSQQDNSIRDFAIEVVSNIISPPSLSSLLTSFGSLNENEDRMLNYGLPSNYDNGPQNEGKP